MQSEINNFRIIVIDDNPDIHRDIIKILTGNEAADLDQLRLKMFGKKGTDAVLPQFEIDTASQGKEGLERIEAAIQANRPYSVAFVDIRMPPGWDGIETIKHIWALDKDIQVVICTAYSDYSWEETVSHLGQKDNLLILKKPFDNVSVRQLACALSSKWQLSQDVRKYTDSLKKQVEDRTMSLQQSLSLMQATFESSSDGILVTNKAKAVIDYNQKFIDILHVPKEVIETKSEEELVNFIHKQVEEPEKFLKKTNQLRDHPNDVSIDIMKLKNGKVIECYSQPHKLNGENVGRVYDFRDITKRAQLEKELQYQATHDALTGLANRVLLLDKIKNAIKISELNNTQFAVLFFDLDRFKLINDSLSHSAGDELLQKVATRLLSAIRTEDTIARLGGDEFVVLLMNVEKDEDVISKVKLLQNSFHQSYKITDRELTVTASIGASMYPKDGLTADELLRNADTAMYRAKSYKGNNFQFYKPDMNDQSIAELDQEIELRSAIDNNELFLCYQPQIDMDNDKLVAVEALIRWRHPQKGILLPMDFIPLAEKAGLIGKIGEWVLRAACKQNKVWQDMGMAKFRVAVNVTGEQFKQMDIIATVKSILEETKLEARYLELELTENIIISNAEIVRIVKELKMIGVIIAIDDFGTGYSSLSFLHKIPLDRLKIDSSFVQRIKGGKDDEVIIRAVIAMAKSLNLEVLAEGVETKDQVDFLKKNQCGDIQGFYFSKPLTSNEIEDMVKNNKKIKLEGN